MTESQQKNTRARARGRILRGLIAVVAILAGAAILGALVSTKPEPPRDPDPSPPVVVRSMTIAPVMVERRYRGYGVVRAVRAVNVSAEVDGRIAAKPASVEEGVRVDRGELLVEIDPGDYRDRAEALRRSVEGVEAQLQLLDVEEGAAREQADLTILALEAIEREIERLRAAVARGAATENEIDQQVRARILVAREQISAAEKLSGIVPRRAQLEAQAASLRADSERAQRDLARTSVVSPIAGLIQEVDVETGERVRAGDRIARVLDPSLLETPLRLPLSASNAVRVGSLAILRADGPGGGEWAGSVSRIAPEADAERRTITVYVETTQDVPLGRAPELPPGRFVLGLVSAGESEGVAVPRGAVDNDRVTVITSEGVIESRAVEIAYYTEGDYPALVENETQWAVIASGLRAGERIAISNLSKLRPGMVVQGADAGAGGAQ